LLSDAWYPIEKESSGNWLLTVSTISFKNIPFSSGVIASQSAIDVAFSDAAYLFILFLLV